VGVLRRVTLAGALAVALSVPLAGCSGSSGGSAGTTTASPVGALAKLRTDLVKPAITALEAKLGGPQRYFEINATASLVNLYVASADGTQATAYVFLDGALTGQTPQSAKGYTFAASALDFDPVAVTAKVTTQLPTSSQDAFVIEGGAEGAVRYSVVTTSTSGGQLVVVVGKDGAIQSVDPA
jgi:hypothetical protein